jgi:signal transduction histidine kinase
VTTGERVIERAPTDLISPPSARGSARAERLPTRAVATAAGLTILGAIVLAGRSVTGAGDLLPVLAASAAIAGALLLRDEAPSLAWLLMIAAALAGGSVSIEAARGLNPRAIGVGAWEAAAARSSVAAVATLILAAAYAAGRARRVDPVARPLAIGLVGWLLVACAVTLGGVAVGVPSDPAFNLIDVATAPISLFVWFVALLVALGIMGDVRRAARRAASRSLAGRDPAALPAPSRPERWLTLGRDTLRELWPGQADLDERSRDIERSRLAGDLHAVVLPNLRRAIDEAERGGDAETLALHLRTVDLELERLMADRWPVVLEAFGIVAALEDLAERIEADGELAVEIDVERSGERPPLAVERAAWRIAELTTENVVRHSEARNVRLVIDVDRDRLTLAVTDDGRGFPVAGAASQRAGARGLADARRRAEAVGARLMVDGGGGGGTEIRFEWLASATHS